MEPASSDSEIHELEPESKVRRSQRYRASITRRAEAAWGIVREYANNSTVHGIRYLAEQKRPVTERIWWFIVLTVCIGFCGVMIYNIYVKWDREPVIVSFAEKPTAIWDISFPAVTICIPVKIKTTLFNVTAVEESVQVFKEIFIDKLDITNRTHNRDFTDNDRML